MSYRQFDDERKVLPDLEIKPDLSEVVQEQQDCSGDAVDEPVQEAEKESLETEDIFVGVKEDKMEKLEPEPVESEPKTRGKDKAKRKKREFTPKMAEQLAKSREVKISKYGASLLYCRSVFASSAPRRSTWKRSYISSNSSCVTPIPSWRRSFSHASWPADMVGGVGGEKESVSAKGGKAGPGPWSKRRTRPVGSLATRLLPLF